MRLALSHSPLRAFAAALCLGLPATTLAADPQFFFAAGPEQYRWSEYDTAGNRLLQESGLRYRFAFRYEKEWRGLVFGGGAEQYTGTVDYDGQTQGGTKATTDVEYRGFRGEGRLGYLWGGPELSLGLLGMYGAEFWSRQLQDGRTASGQRVLGYTERYGMSYVTLGPALQTHGAAWSSRIHAAVRKPLSVAETVDDFAAVLKPKPKPGMFFTWENRWRIGERWHVGVTAYAETLHFAASDPAASTLGAVVQPESRARTAGVRFETAF